MTKLESALADPTPELIGPTRTSVTGLDDDSQPLPIAWSRPRLVSTAAIFLACLVLAILFETIRIYPPYDLGVYQRAAWAMLLVLHPTSPTSPGATPRLPTLRSPVGCSLRSH